MPYALERLTAEITAMVAATGLIAPDHIVLSAPKAANVAADLALPCFQAAKAQGKNPAQLASELAAAIPAPSPESPLLAAVAAGPYLNIQLRPAALAAAILGDITERGESYGCSERGGGKTVIVEYSSPNIAKRMHVGHIRSSIIGQAIANLYACLGYRVVRDNHLGDYGKQFGVNLASLKRFGRPEERTGEAALAALEELYTRYNRLMSAKPEAEAEEFAPESDSELDDEARAWSLKLEQQDPEAVELWQWMVDLTKAANQPNYERLGIVFDTQHGESFYRDMLGHVISDAGETELAERDPGGALLVKGLKDERGKELPTFLLQRSDGGTLYLTRDVATIKYREETYDPAMVVYIVGQPQELHFRQTFAAARALGYSDAELVHVSFGTVFDAEGNALSTRRGNMIYLETMLDEAETRARALIEAKVAEGKTDLSPEQIAEVARMVGVGAVIYNDLYQDRKRAITLDWDRMLAFEGNSAPYLQYMHARCRAILREAGDVPAAVDYSLLAHPAELALLKEIARLPEVVAEAAERFAPFVIADWLYGTARAFSAFYDACSVLKAESEALRGARLNVVAATALALRKGLGLLSIQAPERM